MDEPKRSPTEMEVQLLLRNAGRKAHDEATVGDCALSSERPPVPDLLIFLLAVGTVFASLYFLESMRSWPGMMAALAWILATVQGFEIRRLSRVTKALARIAERARTEPPLPRAPSPPTAATG